MLGRHRGHHRFTVGQRRGLGIGGGTPAYVLSTDARTNRVVVGPRDALRRSEVTLREAVLHRDGARVDRVKLRYRSRPLGATVAGDPPAGRHERLRVELREPVARGATGPGRRAPGRRARRRRSDDRAARSDAAR